MEEDSSVEEISPFPRVIEDRKSMENKDMKLRRMKTLKRFDKLKNALIYMRGAETLANQKVALLEALRHLSQTILQGVNYILVLKKSTSEQQNFKPQNIDDTYENYRE